MVLRNIERPLTPCTIYDNQCGAAPNKYLPYNMCNMVISM